MRVRAWIGCLVALALCGPARAANPDFRFAPGAAAPPAGPAAPDAPALTPAPDGPTDDGQTGRCPLRRLSDLGRGCSGASTWFTAEWVVGSTRGASLMPVVTTGPAAEGLLAGAVGQSGTLPLFGGKQVLNDWRSGLRIEAGVWFDPEHQSGVSGRVYSLFSGREQFTALADGTTVVDIPHFVPVGASARQIPVFVGYPGLIAGTATAYARTTFTGGDLNYRWLIDRTDCSRIELLVGYRQLFLGDELGASFRAAPLGAAGLGSWLSGGDRIHTRNDFFGPQLGLCASTGWNRLTLEGHAATALGVTVSDLDFARARLFDGAQTGTAPPLPGLPGANQIPLGTAATTGTFTCFGVVAEGGVRVNWAATDHIRLVSGYSFLFWNDVHRAPDMFTGGSLLRAHSVDSIVHLVSAGLEVRY